MNAKNLAITLGVIVLLVILTKKSKAAPKDAKFLLDAFWGMRKFKFISPLGVHTITNPDTSTPTFNLLEDTEEYNLGWQAPTEDSIVVSLVHKSGAAFAEVYVLDLVNEKAEYRKEYNEVIIS